MPTVVTNTADIAVRNASGKHVWPDGATFPTNAVLSPDGDPVLNAGNGYVRTGPVAPFWRDLGQCAAIHGAATAMGRVIGQLQPFAGRVFLGYGDWQTGLDACDVLYWDPADNAFHTVVSGVATDAFDDLRVVDGDLWYLVTDPAVGADPDAVIVHPDLTHTVITGGAHTPYPTHLFDAAYFGGHVYVAGADRSTGSDHAAVWRWNDPSNVKDWTLVTVTTARIRVYVLAVLGATLYAFTDDYWGTGTSDVYASADGATWTRMPGFNPGLYRCGKAVPVAGGVVLRDQYGPELGVAGNLKKFTGGAISTVASSVRDHTLGDDGLVYVLKDAGIYRCSADGLTLTHIETPPANARSIGVADGAIYVGTTDSHLWRYA